MGVIVLLVVLLSACQNDVEIVAECDPGWHPCENDQTECCLDTTSHNIIWTIDTLGFYNSILRDVAIVNENNIWVVGNIVVPDPDSSFNGTGRKEYNAAHWDGNKWELIEIYNTTIDLYSIKYFSEDDIWVTSFGFPYHWNGFAWTEYHLQNMGLDVSAGRSIWGSSSDLYFVGYEGSIVHYDGESFNKIESGTEINLTDICGSDEENIWISGATTDDGQGVLLEKNNITWDTIIETDMNESGATPPYDTLYGSIEGLWISEQGKNLWLVNGWGVFNYSISSGKFNWHYPRWWTENDSFGNLYCIRGTADNNVFACGELSTILHYNGSTWRWYQEFYVNYMKLMSIDISQNSVVIVGRSPDRKAVIIRGYQSN